MPSFNLNKVFLTGEIADLGGGGAWRVPIPEDVEGEVIEVRTVLAGAISGSDETVTVYKNASSMGTITVANASSGEGDIDTLVPTSANRFLVKGDYLEVKSAGDATGSVALGIIVTIRR